MIARSKMFLISEDVDESIKSLTSSYDITIFKTFTEFEKYANTTPVVIESLIVSAKDLPFNNSNMTRLINILNSPFMRVTGTVTYLVGYDVKLETVNTFIEIKELKNWVVYQGNLSVKFIGDIITGAARTSSEGQNEIITYRIRASEYIKQQNQLQYESNDNQYYTDEDLLSDIPDVDEPEDISPAEDIDTVVNYVVGINTLDRALMTFFLAQYLSLREKTIIVERDVEYHTLTEIVTKSGIDCEFISVDEFLDDIGYAIQKIRSSLKRLIVVGCKNRRNYDYNFLMDIIQSTTEGNVLHVIRECTMEEIPYGQTYTIVVSNTVPEILKCCSLINEEIESEKVTFVGMQTRNLGAICLTSQEMKSIIEVVLNLNSIAAQVVKVNGIGLKGDEVVYDILSVLNRGNGR